MADCCCVLWAKNIENILIDGSALEEFKLWIKSEPNQSKDPLDFYFAVKAFKYKHF